jgi:hypothetical protein
MRTQEILTTCILVICVQFISCKKETTSPPTDLEILGNIAKPEIIDEYIYPIQPGTPEWAAFQSYDEMLEAVKIPDSVLNKLSTWGLVESCFKYPLGGDNMAMNCPSIWINDLSKSFNGLNKLFSKTDVSVILLYNYRYLDFNKYNWIYWQYIELMVGCDAFVSKLNNRQLLYLVSVAIEKAQVQKDYSQSVLPNSYYIMANAMIHAGYKPFIDYCITQKYLDSGIYTYCHGEEKMEEFAKEFIKN